MLQQMENDARAVLAHPPTLRFLCRMLNEVRYFENPFAGNSNTTFVNVGEQEAGRKIVRALESVDPDALLVLLATASKNRSLNSAENEESSDED
tara:strand:+ start:797 stop:1078 length:282 start_codon:yes stop_codon:yes gene_type:complete